MDAVTFLPFDASDVDDPSVQINKREINESAEARSRGLELLRKNLKNLEGIEYCSDEKFLLRFLRVSKFDATKALQRLKKYHLQSDAFLDAFKKCSASIHKLRNLNHLWLSPYRLRDNSLLIIGRNREVDYHQFNFADRFYLEIISLNHLLDNPVNQVCGLTLLMDYGGFGLMGLRACTPGWLKFFVEFLLSSLPFRVKAVHIVNAGLLFHSMYKISYPFLPKKMQNRVFFHSNKDGWQSLHQSIPADVLPQEYNGRIRNEALISCFENREALDEKFRSLLVFGSSKTKQRRHSILNKLKRVSE